MSFDFSSRKRLALTALSGALFLSGTLFAPAATRADYGLRVVLTRALPTAPPAGASLVRVAVLGDGTSARFQVRLLPKYATADTGAYYTAPSVIVDHKGWKTITFALSDFALQSESNPELPAKPMARENIDRIQLVLTGQKTKIFCDDLVFTSDPDGPPVQLIDNFDAAKSAWSGTGDYFQRQGTGHGINQNAQYAKTGGSLSFSVTHPVFAEQSINSAPAASAIKKTTLPYAVFVRPTLTPIYPGTTPSAAELATKPTIKVVACAEQTESATFSVYSTTALKDATVKLSTVPVSQSKKTALQASYIDLNVIKVWPQQGIDGRGENGTAYLVPELIMKDDRQPLTAAAGGLPTVRLDGNPITDIAAKTSKQFWITVRIPKGQPASTYTGALTFSAAGAKPTTIPLVIDVPAMRLRSPFLQYGIDFECRLSETEGDPKTLPLPKSQYSTSLIDIRDHGFRFVSFYDPVSLLGDAIGLYEAAGLSSAGPLVIETDLGSQDDVKAIESLREAVKTRSAMDIYYGHVKPADARAASRKAQIVTYTPDQAAYTSEEPNFDVAVYPVSGESAQLAVKQGKRVNAKRDWWTWSLGVESPLRNRLFTGYYLYVTGINGAGLYGAFPRAYRSVPQGTNPFDETTGASGSNRPQMATYPVANGVISTVQWESVRSGVNDIRYITNLKTYIRELKDKIKEGKMKDATSANNAVNEAETYLAAVMKKPLISLNPTDIDAIRTGISSRAVKLLGFLRKADAAYPD